MMVAGRFSFNGGEEAVRTKYPHLLDEIEKAIVSIDADRHRTKESTERTMMGRMLYSPSSLNRAEYPASIPHSITLLSTYRKP